MRATKQQTARQESLAGVDELAKRVEKLAALHERLNDADGYATRDDAASRVGVDRGPVICDGGTPCRGSIDEYSEEAADLIVDGSASGRGNVGEYRN